jgi:uncharacterized protein DUF6247
MGLARSVMTAQPAHRPDPEDPAEILQVLPARWHSEFLAESHAALEGAWDVQNWQQLAGLLHRWYLRAVTYSDPGFDAAIQVGRDALPAEMVEVPGL